MALYAIGDLHLSLGGEKPMHVFGEQWRDHDKKLKEGFAGLGPEDLTVLCGDLSWGMSLQQAEEDFRFIHELPGKKIILKGNHDYWWSTANKAYTFFREKGFDSLQILHNNSYVYGDYALCGTRGWFYEEETGGEHDEKIMGTGEAGVPPLSAHLPEIPLRRDPGAAGALWGEPVLLRAHPRQGLLCRLQRLGGRHKVPAAVGGRGGFHTGEAFGLARARLCPAWGRNHEKPGLFKKNSLILFCLSDKIRRCVSVTGIRSTNEGLSGEKGLGSCLYNRGGKQS